jgi:hypothetical protein
MNERIKLLAEQAGSTHKQNLGVYQFYTDELEKFADLILQDCMSICEELGDKGLDGHYCVDKIRKEFGV